MSENKTIGYYQSDIKTSRNEDSVYAIKYASQQALIDKLQQEKELLQQQLKQRDEVIDEAIEWVNTHDIDDSWELEEILRKYQGDKSE